MTKMRGFNGICANIRLSYTRRIAYSASSGARSALRLQLPTAARRPRVARTCPRLPARAIGLSADGTWARPDRISPPAGL